MPLSDLIPSNLLVDPVDHHSQESRHEETVGTVKCSRLSTCCLPSGMFFPHICLIFLSESSLIPLKASLNPNKLHSSLLCGPGMHFIQCLTTCVSCFVFRYLRGWPPCQSQRSFRTGSIFIHLYLNSMYNSHLINAQWMNEIILFCAYLEFRDPFTVSIWVCSIDLLKLQNVTETQRSL